MQLPSLWLLSLQLTSAAPPAGRKKKSISTFVFKIGLKQKRQNIGWESFSDLVKKNKTLIPDFFFFAYPFSFFFKCPSFLLQFSSLLLSRCFLHFTLQSESFLFFQTLPEIENRTSTSSNKKKQKKTFLFKYPLIKSNNWDFTTWSILSTFQRPPVVLSPALSPTLSPVPAPSWAPELCELQPTYELSVLPPLPSFWPVAPAAASPPPKVQQKTFDRNKSSLYLKNKLKKKKTTNKYY